METRISEIREIVGRLDERTVSIQNDVADIKQNYGPRLSRVEGRQHWILGVGTGIGVFIAGAWQWIRGGS